MLGLRLHSKMNLRQDEIAEPEDETARELQVGGAAQEQTRGRSAAVANVLIWPESGLDLNYTPHQLYSYSYSHSPKYFIHSKHKKNIVDFNIPTTHLKSHTQQPWKYPPITSCLVTFLPI